LKPKYFIAVLFGVSLYWMYLLYQPFLMSMTIAALLVIPTVNINVFLQRKVNSKLFAALVSSLLLAILLFGPFSYILTTVTIMLKSIDMGNLKDFEIFIKDKILHPPEFLQFIKPYARSFLSDIDMQSIMAKVIAFSGHIGAFSAGFLKNAFMIVVFYFFMQYYGSVIVNFLKRIVVMKETDSTILAKELSSVMSVVLYSIAVTATFEGILFGIAVSFLGYNGLFYGILFGFASLIPVVGAALLWVPFMSYEFYLGNTYEALFIAFYTVIVISVLADTFIKPMIIQWINKTLLHDREAQLDSLVIFFAMLAGLATFGFWGMILGPAITAFFLSILKVFEMNTKECVEVEDLKIT